MNLEDFIEQVGGFGPFQIMLIILIYGAKLVVPWSMLMMSFAGVTPDWWCSSTEQPMNTSLRDNTTFESCERPNMSCTVVYNDDMSTVVNQWNLICDLNTVPATLTSIQMAGVLVGSIIGGQSSDVIGRKKSYYFSIGLLGTSNLIAAFSVSWQMFGVLRFFVGFGAGCYLTVGYNYVIESYGARWRSSISAVPMWNIGSSLFALSIWLKPDWFYQHIILASLHIPYFLGIFVLPESLRWLTVQGRVGEAEKVVEQMSRYNRKVKPDNTTQILKQVAEEEKKSRTSGRKYTYIDLYRSWSLCWRTFVIQITWGCLSFVFYGLSFGAASLSGNLYLNIFLLGIVDFPPSLTLPYLTNRFGRRSTAIMFFIVCSLSAFSVSLSSRYAPESRREVLILVLALVSKLGVGAGMLAFGIHNTEFYPTVIRNLGTGATSMASRVGAILAPYIFAMKKREVFIPFIIVGAVTAFCSLLCLLLDDTKGRPMEDTLFGTKQDDSKKTGVNDQGTDVARLDSKIQINVPELEDTKL